MADVEQTEPNNKPRYRSPPYPSIGLAKAIERSKQLYGTAMHHPAGGSVLGEAWGYGAKSSGLWATAAALLQYGLATDEGSGASRKVILTDKALRIIRDADPDSEKRKAAIQSAATSPTVFAELIEKFGTSQNVSEVILKNYLILDRAESGKALFSDQAADDLISIFRQTIDYAGIKDSGTLPPDNEDKDADEEEDISEKTRSELSKIQDRSGTGNKTPPADTKGDIQMGERELTTGLLSKDAGFRLIVNGKIGAKEIDRLIAKLELDKEILAESDEDDRE